ncbi:hypothetical protein FN846DRAFT_966092 [Sphaerosporella brunnea]|uniref:Uncharacterized protein n=1 Tax=Sphaerosporella brunnea TaxID=1250544 RepID=A0A5J5EMB7_9PEZI|nr:hypothetical protein FN846DRAFT_966092 [Sphaerosporella brunnea]
MLPPHSPALRRAFGTSARRLVGPEHPNFIEIPRVKLPKAAPPQRKKGILPKPRTLFPDSRPEKGTIEYTKKATPLPKPQISDHPQAPEAKAFQEWQAAMASKRRANLREGMRLLKKRKVSIELARAKILRERSKLREEKLAAAEREDVRLTLPSILSTIRLQEKGLKDPDRAQRLQEMAARREAQVQKKKQERQQLIHELYLNAGDFILTERDLDRAIDEQFREKDQTQVYLERTKPPTVREMLVQKERNAQGEGLGGMGLGAEESAILEVGGALTGGRMSLVNHLAGRNMYGV